MCPYLVSDSISSKITSNKKISIKKKEKPYHIYQRGLSVTNMN